MHAHIDPRLSALELVFAVAAIFMYHHVSPVVQPGLYQRALTVTPAEFRLQLAWLRDHGCVTRTVTDLVALTKFNDKTACDVALTFDDGYEDAARFAAPLLERDGDVATFYVTTGFVGSAGHMSADEVAELGRSGMEIGAHTVTHADLVQLAAPRARAEIEGSKSALERWTRARVRTFAYPAGSAGGGVQALVRNAGFETAVTTQPGRLTPAAIAQPFTLPRYRIVRGSGIALFQSVLGPLDSHQTKAFDPVALHNIARSRIEGNDAKSAERIAVALLEHAYPEQILKVKILKEPPADVAGILLSGVKFHAAVSPTQFAADVGAMIDRVFAVDPQISEVDVWAVVPIKVASGTTVAGDLAAPTSRTVYSIAARRSVWRIGGGRLAAARDSFWDPEWRNTLKGRATTYK